MNREEPRWAKLLDTLHEGAEILQGGSKYAMLSLCGGAETTGMVGLIGIAAEVERSGLWLKERKG